MSQFLVLPEDVDLATQTAQLKGEEAHHLARVARVAAGDLVRLFDGSGRRWEGRAARIEKDFALVEKLTPLAANEPGHPVRLIAALIKGERWEWLLEKAVELGATAITPLLAERCIVKHGDDRGEKQLARWRKISLASSKQSERGIIVPIETPVTLPALMDELQKPAVGEKRWLFVERGRYPRPTQSSGPLLCAVGPEGGWTGLEIELFLEAGFTPATLGPRVLRSETAALAALTLAIGDR